MMDTETIASGRFLQLVRSGRWEYAERKSVNGVVVIVPFTEDGQLLLIEQFRPPVKSQCIEFPAGLSGDSTDASDEPQIEAARRELLEETGYEASEIRLLANAASSAGLTSETITYFEARGLRRIAAGGGIENEQILMHHVPLSEVRAWLAAQSQRCVISATVYAGLYLTCQ